MQALTLVAGHGPPGAWIGAGLIRNAVWDALHGRIADPTAADIDVVRLDPARPDRDADRMMAARLTTVAPGLSWSVTNQARMAHRNGHADYTSLADAIAHWPETATAVAARVSAGRLQLLAPHGLADLRHLRLRPTPAFRDRLEVIAARGDAKGWRARWPRLVWPEC